MFEVNTDIPTITIYYPQSIAYPSNITTLNFSVVDGDLQSCWYTLDNGVTNVSTPCDQNVSGLNAGHGLHNWTVWANDTGGTEGFFTVEFEVDTVIPSLDILSPVNQTYHVQYPVEFNVSGSENLDYCIFSFDDFASNYSMTAFNQTFYNYTNSSMSPGGYLARFWCNDSVGNANNTESIGFSVAYPQIDIDLLVPEGNIDVSYGQFFEVSLNVSCSVVDCGIANVSLDPLAEVTDVYNVTGDFNFTVPSGVTQVTVLVVGGGGGAGSHIDYGGTATGSGGGGAGGLIYDASYSVTPGEVINITVGAGGISPPVTAGPGQSGEDSVFGTLVAVGGGGGGNRNTDAFDGGSGGGGGYDTSGGSGTAGQGFAGGSGTNDHGGSGGGGAGGIGESGNGNDGRAGGVGLNYISVFGTDVGENGWFAGGGAGGGRDTGIGGVGGVGGGGDGGANADGNPGLNGTGGGGGGGGDNGNKGGDGGSGIVIVKYTTTVKSGLIPVGSGSPFFTNASSNPLPTSSLSAGGSEVVTFWVNSTGLADTYEFFAFVNLTENMSIYDVSEFWNVSIVSYDVIPPILSAISPLDQTYTTQVLDFNVSANENLSSCYFSLDNWAVNYSMSSWNATYFNYTNSSVNEGNYLAEFWCNDTSGNVGTTSVNFSVDVSDPNITLVAPENNSVNYSGTYVGFYFNVSDTSSIENCSLYIDDVFNLSSTDIYRNQTNNFSLLLQPGDYLWYVQCFDVVGFNGTSETRNLSILDINPPNGTLLTPSNGTLTNVTSQNLTVNLSDDVGLLNATLSIYNETGDLINMTTVSVSGTEALIGIVYEFLYDGIFTWFYSVYDLAGNFFVTGNNTITIDTVYPSVEFGEGTVEDGGNRSETNVYVNISIVEINEANVTFGLWNTTGLVNSTTLSAGTREFNWTSLSDGVYYYNVTVRDLVNQVNYSETRSITLDTSFPEIDYGIGTDIDGVNRSRTWIYVNVTVDELLESNITFRLWNSTDEVNSTVYFDGTREINWTGLSEGNYTYNVSVVDIFGRVNSTETRIITLDTTLPFGNLTTPGNESLTNITSQNLTVNVSDFVGLDNVTLNVYNETGDLINSTTVSVSGTEALIGIVYEFLYDGIFTWFYQVYDVAGNLFTTGNNTITIDTTTPGIYFGEVTEENFANKSRDWIFVNVSVVELNEANITFGLWNSTGIVNSTTLGAGNRSVNFTGLEEGLYYYNVTVIDLLGYVNSTETRTLRLDRTDPNATLISPGNGTLNSTTSHNFSVNVSDDIWLANVTLRIWNSTALINTTSRVVGGNESLLGIVYNFTYDDDFVWFYRVYDMAGNYFDSENWTIEIDTTNPLIDFADGTLGDGVNVSQSFVYVNVSVTEVNEANITFGLWNTSGEVNVDNSWGRK
jgi:hypothetical protein